MSKRRLGSFYLNDVRALISERDAALSALKGMLELDGFRPRDGSVNPEWEAQILSEARAAANRSDDA